MVTFTQPNHAGVIVVRKLSKHRYVSSMGATQNGWCHFNQSGGGRTLGRFGEHITRVEAHIADENSHAKAAPGASNARSARLTA
jgi:hypothetical protein